MSGPCSFRPFRHCITMGATRFVDWMPMERRQEIIYMQVRIARLAAEHWRVAPHEAMRFFGAASVPEYIEENYELLHLEGDEAVLADVLAYMAAKGVGPDADAD